MDYTNELESEIEVNKSLMQELARRNTMATLFKLEDGRVIKVKEFEFLSQEELQEERDKLVLRADLVSSFINKPEQQPANELSEPVAETVAQPAVETPADVVTPQEAPAVGQDTVVSTDVPAEPTPGIQLQ